MSSSHLSPAQIAELQQALETRQAEMQARLTEVQGGKSRVDHAQQVLQQDADDAPQRDSDREVNLAMNDMGEVDLARVNGALMRIANGTYGLCDACDCPIPTPACKSSRKPNTASLARANGRKAKVACQQLKCKQQLASRLNKAAFCGFFNACCAAPIPLYLLL